MTQSASLNMLLGKLPQFPGARVQDEAIAQIGLGASDFDVGGTSVEPDSHSVLVYSVWCVCFHLYSGSAQFYFEILDTEHQRRVVETASVRLGVCNDIGPCDTLHDVKNRLVIHTRPVNFGKHGEGSPRIAAFASNTAVQLVPGKPGTAYLNDQLPRQVDVLLRVALNEPTTKGDDAGRFSWHLIYRRSFIGDQEASSLAETVKHVARTLLLNPTRKIAEVGVSPYDWDVLSKWNKVDQEMERREQLVHHAFAAAVRAHSEEPALAAWDGQMNYRELDEASSALAKHLSTASDGLSSDRTNKWVALCFGKSRWAIVAMLAVLKAGYACVFLDPSYPDHRLRQILEALGTRIVLTYAEDKDLVVRLSNLRIGNEGPITLHLVPRGDETSSASRINVEIDVAGSRLRRDSGVEVVSATSPADPAFAIFTSGSTGTPKAIVLTHSGICTSISRIAGAFGVNVSSRILQFASYAFDASLSDILTGLFNGAKICIPSDDERRDDLQAYMHREQINLAWLTPTVARMLDPAVSSIHLRQLVLIGEAIAQADTSRWTKAGVAVYNGYGPAEATFVATLTKCREDLAPRNIGQGLNYRTWVVSIPEVRDECDQIMVHNRYLLPIGARGELFLEGPSLAQGYLNDTANTESSFMEDPAWLPSLSADAIGSLLPRRVYSTKDMVRYCPDGSLEYLGRVSHDSQIKLGGQRVELAEIEIQLAQTSTAAEFIVVLPKSGPLRGRLAACFASDEGTSSTGNTDGAKVELVPFRGRNVDVASRCAAYLRTRLPPHMIPSIWVSVDKLPVNASGKRNKTGLLHKLESLSKREASDLCYRVEDEEAQDESYQMMPSQQPKKQEAVETMPLRLACSQIFQIDLDRVPVDGVSFIRLGGDSIAAMRVSTKLRRTAGLKVSVRDLMTCSSLRQVVSKIEYAQVDRRPTDGVNKQTDLNEGVNHISSSSRSRSSVPLPIPETLLAQIAPQGHSLDSIADFYPCTPMQMSLLLSQSRMAGEAVYHLSMAWRVSCPTAAGGSVDTDCLQAAWHQAVERHGALRTVIVEESSAFYQVVLRQYRSPCVHLWLEDERDVAQTVLSHQPASEAAVVPTKARCARPACRVVVYSVRNSREVYLRLDVNHVLLDGLSALNILRYISTAYRSLVDEVPTSPHLSSPLSCPTMRDFVYYTTGSGRQEESLAYWKEYLEGVESCIFPELVDGCRADEDRRRADESATLPISMQDVDFPALCIKLSENETTVASLFLLVWSIVLRVYLGGGEYEAVFGYLASGRDAAVDGIDDAVGCFISMLVCRAGWTGQEEDQLSLLDALRRIQRASVDGALHQAVSLADIYSAVADLEGGRLFNTTVTFMPLLDEEAQQGSALVYEQVLNRDPTEFDMSLAIETSRTSLQAHLIYRPSYISHSHAERIAETVHHVVGAFLQDPHRVLGSVCGPSNRDLDTIWHWNKRAVVPAEACLHDMLQVSMQAHADREAICSWDGVLSYGELDGLSSTVARYLREVHRVGPEVVVPLLFEKSCWSVVAQVAVLRCGGCFVMLQPSWPDDRVRDILSEVEAQVLLHSGEMKPKVTKWMLESSTNRGVEPMVAVQVDQELVDRDNTCETEPFGSCRGRAREPMLSPDNTAYVIYTSGSTGRPKGIAMTHRAVCSGTREHAKLLKIGPRARVLSLTAISFDMAVENVVLTLQAGGCLCIPSEEDRLSVDGVTSFIAASRANWLSCTPSFLNLFSQGPACMPTIEVVVVAGEPVAQHLVDLWASSAGPLGSRPGRQQQQQNPIMFVNAYGPSECALGYCVAATSITAGRTSGHEIGRGFRAVTWVVNEHADDELRPIGAVGELLLEGPCLARGYLKQQDLTDQAFIDSSPRWSRRRVRPCGRLYKTGDLVRYNSDGSLLYVGRKDEQVKINGIRTELGDIESRLSSAVEPRLRDVCQIFSVLLEGHGGASQSADLLVAFVYVPGRGKTLIADGTAPATGAKPIIGDPEETTFQAVVGSILRHENFQTVPLCTQLPRHMMPKAFIPLVSLPMTSSGKVNRRGLRLSVQEMHRDQLLTFHTMGAVGQSGAQQQDVHRGQLATCEESELAEIWKRVLRVGLVSSSDSFFRLGGDSLAVIALKAQVHRLLGHELAIADIFACPVLKDMAEKMRRRKEDEAGDNEYRAGSLLASPVEPFSLLSIPGGRDVPDQKDRFLADISRECGFHIAPDDIQDVLPCTPMQEALMAASAHSSTGTGSLRGGNLGHGGTSKYSVQVPYRLSNETDMDAFRTAWELVVRTTPVLRSRIVFLAGYGSLLVICCPSAPPFERVKLSSSLESYLETLSGTQRFGYGLPLFRLYFLEGAGPRDAVRSAEGDNDSQQASNYLVLSTHHAVYDGWSLRLLWFDVLKAYRAVKRGRSALYVPVDSPPFQALVRHLQRQPRADSEKYWTGLFEQSRNLGESDEEMKDSGLEFPQVPTQHQPLASCRKSFALEPLEAKLLSQTQLQGITPTAVIQAAWAIVLGQYSARRTVSFGCTLSGRDLPIRGIEDLRGPTMTVVPLQVTLRLDQSAVEYVRHVQDTVATMMPHGHLGLQNIQCLGAAASQACAFSSLLTVQPPDGDGTDDDDANLVENSDRSGLPTLKTPSRELGITMIEPVEVSGFHPLPLALQVFRNRSHTKIVAEVNFDPQCLDAGLLEVVMHHFAHVLRILWCQVGGGQSSTCSNLAYVMRTLSKAHVAQMMAWNTTEGDDGSGFETVADKSRVQLLQGMFERQAVQRPEAPAIVAHDGSYTYLELNDAADLLAADLFRMNDRRVDHQGRSQIMNPIGLCFEHSACALVAMLAVLKAGAPFLPLSPSNPPARAAEMLQDAGCTLILASPIYLKMFSGECRGDTRRTGREGGRMLLAVDKPMLDSLRSDAKWKLLSTNSPKKDIAAISDTHLAYILFTSGSTGRPKGVKMAHGACAAAVVALGARFGLDQHTRRLQFTDYSFDNSIEDVFGTLSAGGCVCVPSDSDRVNDLAAFCGAHAVNSLHVTPSVLRFLLTNNVAGELQRSGTVDTNHNLPGIKSCVIGGEPLMQRDVELIDQWIRSAHGHLRVFYAYGSTETCIDCTAAEIVPPQLRLDPATGELDVGQQAVESIIHSRARNIGRSINQGLWRTWIVSPVSNTLAALGAVGELCVEGPALAQGYLEASASQHTHLRREPGNSTKFVIDPLWHPSTAAICHDASNSRAIRVYHTGDLARYESDGTILYLGRRDGQIKINGKRVELGEVEDHIMRSEKQQPRIGVREVAVGLCDSLHLHAMLLMTDDDVAGSSSPSQAQAQVWEEDAIMGIRFSMSRITTETAAALHQSLMRTLPPHMVPLSFIAVDRIPATASGKRDSRHINGCLQAMCLRMTALSLDGEVAGDYAREWELHGDEALLQLWWAEVLVNVADPKHIAPDAHFFSLGANSINAIKLAGLARRAGYALRYEDIFCFPVLSDMATHMYLEAPLPQGREPPLNQHYTAFSLLDVKECEMILSSAAQEYGIARELIQDAYPCTPLQDSLLAATARSPGTYIMAEQVETSWDSLPRVKQAFEYAVRMFETFRACIIAAPAQTSAIHPHVHVVLHHPPVWLEAATVDALVESVRADFGFGQPLVRLGLVPPSSPLHRPVGDNAVDDVVTVVLVAHHAAYDGPAFDLFWRIINDHLTQAGDCSVHKSPGIAPFSAYVKYMESHFNAEEARTWWKADLDGFGNMPCSLTRHNDLSLMSSNHHQPLATSIRHRSVLLSPKKAHGAVKTTLAITARAAWSLTLSHFTASPDTVYGAGINVLGSIAGEAASGGLDQVAGPTIATVPSRALIDYDETVAGFLRRMHRHAAAEIQFAYLGLQAIANESPFCRKACEFDNIFVIQQQSSAQYVKDGGGGEDDGFAPTSPRKLSGSHCLGASRAQFVGAEAFYPHPVVVVCYPRVTEECPDLDVHVSRTECLDIEFIHDPMLVSDQQADSIVDVFVTILRNLTDDTQTNTPLRHVSALSKTGLDSVLSLVRPDLPLPRIKAFLHHLVRVQARSRPLSEAISAWDGCLTYQELEQETSCLSARLTRSLTTLKPLRGANRARSLDLADGAEQVPVAPIAFLLDKGKWPVITMLAIMKAGSAFVPLDRRYPLQRMQRIIDLTGVQLVVTQKAYDEVTGHLGCHSLFIEDISSELGGNEAKAFDDNMNQLSMVDPDTSTAYILFTSGSTGTPKGVVMPHSSLCNALIGLAQAGIAPLTHQSRVLQFSSYTFDASMWEIFSTLLAGGTVCVPSEHDRLDNLEDMIRRFSVDEAMLTPSVSRIIDCGAVAGCLRTLRLCGEAISHADRARWTAPELGIKLICAYGTTESGIVSHYHDLSPTNANHRGIGRSIQCRTWVVNSLTRNELAPRGGIGELCVEGWVLASGYLGEDSMTAAVFIQNPSWMPAPTYDPNPSGVVVPEECRPSQEGTVVYTTGDLVYYDDDGTLTYVGRKGTDTQVKLRGQRVELGEVETAIQNAVRSCVLSNGVDIPVAVELFTPQLEQGTASQTLGVAFAIGKLQGKGHLDIHEVYRQVAATLPAYMVPTHFITLDQLPLNGAGKLDRAALPTLMASTLATRFSNNDNVALPSIEGSVSAVGTVPEPLSEKEIIIRAILAELLRVPDVGQIESTDDFFSLGGHSIIAMRLVSLARSKGLAIRVADIFAHPTIAGIASHAQVWYPPPRQSSATQDLTHIMKPLHSDQDLLFSKVAKACNISTESIDAIYPCTPTQVALRSHAVRFFFALHDDVDIHRLHQALELCVAAYPILRTRIVPRNDPEKHVQVVLKHTCHPLDCMMRDNSSGARGRDQVDALESLDKLMELTIQVAEGGPRQAEEGAESSSSRYLIWTLSHALYDGWSLNLLIQAIEQVYRDPASTLAPSLPFADFVHYQTRQREAAFGEQFWKTYLRGVPPQQPLLFDYARLSSRGGEGSSPDLPQRDASAVYHICKPKLAHAGGGVTAAAVIVAAWAAAVGAATQVHDLTIAYIVSGRSADLAGIETCVGPTVCRVPLRITLPPVSSQGSDQGQVGRPPVSPHSTTSTARVSESVDMAPLATHVQQQLARIMPYELSGLDGVRLLSESPHLEAATLPLEILVQPPGSVLKPQTPNTYASGSCQKSQQQHVSEGGGQDEKLLRLAKAEPIRKMSGGFMVEVSLLSDEEEGLEMTARWDRRIADKGRVDKLVESVRELLGDQAAL